VSFVARKLQERKERELILDAKEEELLSGKKERSITEALKIC